METCEETAPAPVFTMTPAPIWRRIAAGLCDFGILLGGCGSISRVVTPFGFSMYGTSGADAAVGLTALLCLIFIVEYFVLLDASSEQGTFGKQWLGIQVIRTNAGELSKGRAFRRAMVKLPTLLLWGVGFVFVVLTKRRRALYDYAAGTLVVNSEWWMAIQSTARPAPIVLTTDGSVVSQPVKPVPIDPDLC